MNRRIRRSIKHAWPILIAPWLIAAPALVAPAQTPETSQPPDDVLGGRRLLLPIQDLVAAGTSENTILETDQGSISNQIPYGVEGDPVSTASGRVFDLANDVIVTLAHVGEINATAVLTIRDPLGDRTLHVSVPGVCLPQDTCPPTRLELDDLTGDGYDDIVIGWGPDSRGAGLVVAAAKDVASFTDGLVFGEPFTGATEPGPLVEALAIGDLNGDGQGEIAVVNTPLLEIYTLVTPPDMADPGLNIELAASATFAPAVGDQTGYALQIGQFDEDITDRELVVGYNGADIGDLSLVLAQVAADLTPTLGEAFPVGISPERFELAAGRLDWFSSLDQLVLAFGSEGVSGGLTVVVVDDESFFVKGVVQIASVDDACLDFFTVAGLALGDFDFNMQDPESTPPDLEVAALLGCDSPRRDGKPEVQLFKVDLSGTPEITFESVAFLSSGSVTGLVASDTQGRSLLLGSPEKVAIDQHSQPLVVMGAPPMHIDFVEDPEGSSASFGKVNMTAFPGTDNTDVAGMDSAFEFASTTETGVSRAYQTSVSYAVKVQEAANPTLDIPVFGNLGGSAKFAATTSNDNIAAHNFGNLVSGSVKTDTVSGFGDVVWYSTRRLNLWIYRVLGHFACPNDDPDCNATLPLFLTFSGPDQISTHARTPASGVEWYQPHHEVGNILSYPTNAAQLAQALGMSEQELDQLNTQSFTTGSNEDTTTVTWTQGQTEAQTAGSVHTHSLSKTFSLTGGSSFSYNESYSSTITKLNTSVQQTVAGTGFKVRVPAFDFGDDYSYTFDAYILGTQATPDVLQTELFQKLESTVDHATHGTLRLAFSAQPDQAAGNWWTNGTAPYLSAPDVALQHPTRWSLLNQGSAPLSSIYCFNVLDRDDVTRGGGYEIKGLFVLPEGAIPAEGPTPGPQVTTANEGDGLDLQARVYNYSRLDMAQGTAVKVQFYGQEWLPKPQQQFTGDAFLIDEVTLDLIPPISSEPNAPLNSRLASTTFDTGSCPLEGGCGGKYLKFWLVVWMEDAAGNLVADYREHGLKKAPSGPLTQIGHADIQPISNNIGYYDQEIYICPQGAHCDGAAGEVTLAETMVSSDRAAVFETLEVSARLESGEEAVGPLMVFFYDGDPENGGQAFEVEHVPFIAANDSYLTKVRYQPRTSGVHDLFVVAESAGRAVTGTTRLEVNEPADPAASTCQNPLTLASRQNGSITRVGELGDSATIRLSAIVPFDRPVDLRAATVTIDRLAHEPGGAGELIRDADGASILPLTLEADPVARTGGAEFATEPGVRPQVRLKLRPARGDQLRLDLLVRRASVPGEPALCSGDPVTTTLMARLASIDDGVNPPLEVPVEGTWECDTDGAGEVRKLSVRNTFDPSRISRGRESGPPDQATLGDEPPQG